MVMTMKKPYRFEPVGKLSFVAAVRSHMTIQAFLDLAGNDPRFLTINKGIVVNAGNQPRALAVYVGVCAVQTFPARSSLRAGNILWLNSVQCRAAPWRTPARGVCCPPCRNYGLS